MKHPPTMYIERILRIFLLAFALSACDKKPVESVTLAVQPSTLSFDAAGGTKELTVTCGVRPLVTCTSDWIGIKEGDYASNTLSVRITASPNTGISTRTATLRIIGDKQNLTVAVTQDPRDVEISVSADSFPFTRFGGEAEFTVTSPGRPQVTSEADWCGVIVGESDSQNHTRVKLQVAANPTDQAQTGTVTVRNGADRITVRVSREAGGNIPVATAEGLTPQQVFDAMAPGWNLGNQMDAINNGVSGETVWGNPKCTQATMDGVKAAGFKAVRICVTWEGHIGPAPAHRLDEKWLSRVAEIVDYAEKAGLIAIVNTHHDESYWLDIAKAYDDAKRNEAVKNEIFCVWTQIAQRFADKGEWLILESFNEIQDGGWGWSDAFRKNPQAQYRVLNEWNQLFVDAVRSTGGQNATRWLGIPGYAASPAFTVAGLELPKDYTTGNRLMVAAHDYDPYNYTLSNPLVRQWGHTADADKRVSDRDEANLIAVFDNLKTAYVDKGIPVYLGEMGCSRHEAADIPYQRYYMEYFCKGAADRVLPMYLWDNGYRGTGSETHAYLDHATGQFVNDESRTLVGLIVKAVTEKDPAYTLESVYDSAP